MSQCALTLICCVIFKEGGSITISRGIRISAYGQLLFSLVLFGGYCFAIGNLLNLNLHQFIQTYKPRRVMVKSDVRGLLLDPYLFGVASSFVLNTVIKHVLTVGDKLVLVAFSIRNEEKGAYKLVSDLGSLVARILFLPLEETSRAYFSKSLTNNSNLSDERAAQNSKASLDLLSIIIRFHILLGAFFVFIARNYTRLLLKLLYSKTSLESSTLLSIYCCYVPLMGLNGIVEAFLQGVGNRQVLARQSAFMIVFWAIFIASSYLVIVVYNLGSTGVILSNMLNMTMRITFASHYIWFYFGTAISRIQFIPGSRWLWTLFIISYYATEFTSHKSHLIHITGGVIAGILLILELYRSERNGLLKDIVDVYNKN